MQRLIAFLATARPDAARGFYRDVLDLRFVEETEFSLVFMSGETMLRIQKVAKVALGDDTSLGWEVDDLAGRLETLIARGVTPLRFDGTGQDRLGIWTASDGTRVAWINDPDGNILSFTQFAAA
ncbi:MAG: VOC family protein [Bauldia sp.]